MYSRIEVFFKQGTPDPLGNNVQSEIETFGFSGITGVRVCQVFVIFGDVSASVLDAIAQKLLVDAVTQGYQVLSASYRISEPKYHLVEVSRKPGVMDPVEQSALKALGDVGITVAGVKTAHKYLISGNVPAATIRMIATRVLANTKIEDVFIYPEIPDYEHGNIRYTLV